MAAGWGPAISARWERGRLPSIARCLNGHETHVSMVRESVGEQVNQETFVWSMCFEMLTSTSTVSLLFLGVFAYAKYLYRTGGYRPPW